jgi:hypothetical protein
MDTDIDTLNNIDIYFKSVFLCIYVIYIYICI